MSVWSTRSTLKDTTYIVLQHPIKSVNATISGVKFRSGYAVVEKNSKVYNSLRQFPILRGAKEFPLIHLRKLPFITRTSDVRMVYGQDVFMRYAKVLKIELDKEAIVAQQVADAQHKASGHCHFTGTDGNLCTYVALPNSPSHYCSRHILKDEKLKDLDIHIPRLIANDEQAALKEKVLKKLDKIKVDDNGQDSRQK